MSSSDETTGTGEKHEPVQDGYRDHCGTCWRGVEVSAPPGEVRYRVSRAPWPCENARLRERVAALADTADDLVSHPTPVAEDGRCWFCGSGLGSGPTGHKHACAWRRMKAALAQADDGGRA